MVLDPERWLELRRFRGLVETGAMSLSEVAKETGLNWRTVSKYLSAEAPVSPPRRSPNGRSRARVIDEFAPLVDSMLRAEILMKAAVIHERLAGEYGFSGNYQRTKLYVQEARPRIAEELGISPKELAGMHRRFEVIPGAQAQWDRCTLPDLALSCDLRSRFPSQPERARLSPPDGRSRRHRVPAGTQHGNTIARPAQPASSPQHTPVLIR